MALADEALSIARTVDPGKDALAYFVPREFVAQTFAWLGMVREALDVASEVPDVHSRSVILRWVAQSLVQSGRTDEAKEVAHKIESVEDRAVALATAAKAMAKAGETGVASAVTLEAIDAAMRIQPLGKATPVLMTAALVIAAEVLADAGRASDAIKTANQIPDVHARERALSLVAAGLARAGKVVPAIDLATGIASPSARVHALLGVSSALRERSQ